VGGDPKEEGTEVEKHWHNCHTIPTPLPLDITRYARKTQIRIKFRRRAAIELIIGHLKHDPRMKRNFLKGLYGDFVNCMLAAAGFNLKKMLRKIASSLDGIIAIVYTITYALFYKRLQTQKSGF
jgi:hypothetical protein